VIINEILSFSKMKEHKNALDLQPFFLAGPCITACLPVWLSGYLAVWLFVWL
jgi:hypothetical protein